MASANLPLSINDSTLFATDEFDDFRRDREAYQDSADPLNPTNLLKGVLNSGTYLGRRYDAPTRASGEQGGESGVVKDYERFMQLSWLKEMRDSPLGNQQLQQVADKFNTTPQEVLKFLDEDLLTKYEVKLGSNLNVAPPEDFSEEEWEQKIKDVALRPQEFYTDPTTGDKIPLPREEALPTQIEKGVEYVINPIWALRDMGISPVQLGVDSIQDTRRRQAQMIRNRNVSEENVNRGFWSEFVDPRYWYRRPYSPSRPTIQEAYRMLPEHMQEDPSLRIAYEDTYKVARGEDTGLIISSDLTNNEPIPFFTINPAEQAFTEGELTPIVNETLTLIGQEALPILASGGVGTAVTKTYKDKFRERIQKVARNEIEVGDAFREQLAKEGIDLDPSGRAFNDLIKEPTWLAKNGKKIEAALVSSVALSATDTLMRAAIILNGALSTKPGDTRPVQPQLGEADGFIRVAKDSGALFALAFGGDLAGDMVYSSVKGLWRRLTGRRVPADVEERLQVAAEKMRQQIGLFSGRTVKGELDEYSEAEMQKVMRDWVGANGEQLAQNLDVRSFADLSEDQVLKGLEFWFLHSLPEGDKARVSIQRMFKERESKLLDNWYQSIYSRLEDDARKLFPSKQAINQHFTEIMETSKRNRLELEKAELSDLEGALDIDNTLGAIVDRDQRRLAAANLTERGTSPDPQVINRNPVFVQLNENYDDAHATIDELLLNDPKFTDIEVKIAPFTEESFRDWVDTGKEDIFSTSNMVDAAEAARSAVPGKEDFVMNIKRLLGEERAPSVTGGKQGVKLPYTAVSLGRIIKAIGYVEEEINSTANPVLKTKLKKFRNSLIEAREKGYDRQQQKFPGEDLRADVDVAYQNLYGLREQVGGGYVADLLSKGDTEIGGFVLNSAQKDVEGYINVVNQLDNGAELIGNLTTVVTDAIRNEIEAPNAKGLAPTPIEVANRFQRLIRERKAQLEAIYGKDQLNRIKSYEELANTTREDILRRQELVKTLERELADGTGMANPSEIIDRFFKSGKDRFGYTISADRDKLIELSKIADENPELRGNLQGIFARYLKEGLVRDPMEFARAFPGRKMREIPEAGLFDLDALRALALTYPSNQAFARDLSLIVGKEKAGEYASALRVLAKKLENANSRVGFDRTAAHRVLRAAGRVEEMAQRSFLPQIDQHGINRKLTLYRERLEAMQQRFLAEILADPAKIQKLNKRLDDDFTQKQYLKVLANIAFGTSANIGGEMDVTELEKIIDSTDALRLSLFDVFGDFTDDDAAVAAP